MISIKYAFDKAKVPRGLSFPLKRSVLDAALMEAEVAGIHHVYYWLRQCGQIVLRADFCGEGRSGWAAAGLASITLYAVPSPQRQATETVLVLEVLPRMVRWLKNLESSGNVRRGVDQHFVASWEKGIATVEAS